MPTLELLLGELVDAKRLVNIRIGLAESFPIEPMKLSIWSATRDSGNLAYISEPHLLSCIADTYRLIAFLNDREKHAQTVAYGINVTFPDGENAGQRLLRENRGFYQPLMNQINKAIIAISNELSSKSSEER